MDGEGRVCLSATENVGLDAMRLEIVRKVKAARPNNPMELPEGWYRKMCDHIVSMGTMPKPTMPSRNVVRASSETAK